MSRRLASAIKTRSLSMLIIIALLSFPLGSAFATEPSDAPSYPILSGSGTANDPFVITECSQLNHVNVAPDASYLIQNYLYCDGVDVTPVNNFTGQYFDGANYQIYQLNISDAENDNVGLFRQIGESSTIENISMYANTIDTTGNESADLTVGLIAAVNNGTIRNISNPNPYYGYYSNLITTRGIAGGLVGINNGTIQASSVSTNFTPQEGANNIFGGIAGIDYGTIEDVSSNSILNTSSTAVADAKCGGLVGQLEGGSISRSFATGILRCDGTSPSGGLVGLATGQATVADSFAKNANGSLELKGAIVGSNPENIDLSTTYYDGTLLTNEPCDDSGNTTCNKVVQANYFQVKTSPVYENWDIDSTGGIWRDPYEWGLQDYYLPQLNSYYNVAAFPVEITKVQATETTATFKWKNKYHGCGSCNYYRDTSYDIYVGIVPNDAQGDQVDISYELLGTVEKSSNEWWDEFKYEVADLDPNIYYDYIIIPRTHAGEGLQSDSIEIRSVPQKLSTPEVISTFSGALKLQWNNISNIAQRYTVEYKKSTDSTWNSRTTGNFPASSSTIYPLENNTSYDFRVRASNLRGTGEVSDVLTASTISQNVYEVNNCEDLQAINGDLFGHYTLTQDIDCSASNDWNDGQGFTPIGITDDVLQALQDGAGLDTIIAFQGTLDGQGHKINQLHINLKGVAGGLFAFIDGATVKDLALDGGNILGSSANNGTVYTDSPLTMVAGGLAALAANSVIDNVSTNIDIPSNNTDGQVGLSGGLIGGIMPSAFGPGSLETSVSITDSHALGDSAGFVTAGLIGAIIPADALKLSTVDIYGLEDPVTMQETLANIGTRIDVTISDSTTSGDLKCSILCGGIVGLNGSNFTISNVTRSGNIGSFEKQMSENSNDIVSIIEMLGPISAGAVGVNLPMSFNDIPAKLTISDMTINGSINGTATAGIIGISGPAISLKFDEFINAYNDWDQSSNGSDQQFLDVIYSALDHISLTKSFDITNINVNAQNSCVLLCTGASLVNLGDGVFDNVNINGSIAQNVLDEEAAANYGETFSMVSMFGPITAGFVGVNMPISTSESGIGLTIKNSKVMSNLSGTLTSGLVALSLPGISVDVQQFEHYFTPFWRAISNQIDDEYRNRYGGDYYNDEELTNQRDAEITDGIGSFAGFAASVVGNSTGLTILDATVNGDINCSIVCSGASGISLSRTIIDGFTQIGNITNDNTELISHGNPVSICPAQITGGVVGSQLLLPLEVKNAKMTGDISVNQAGTLPEDSVASVIDSIFNPTEEQQNNGGITGTQSLIQLGCALGSSLLQGTGGITGSYFNPIDLSNIIDGTAGFDPGTSVPWINKISNTSNEGTITSNSRSATGGLIGMSMGKTEIRNSKNKGDITNSTFAEMFRTPLASAATGGLVGHSIGAFAAGGNASDASALIIKTIDSGNLDNIIDVVLEATRVLHLEAVTLDIEGSSSTGNVNSSNTAGGLIGTASNGARVNKSFATGNVYGVTAGGLLGSGFNMGSPLGILDMFSTLDISNSYARGNVIASDADNTFTFAGGLVGFMAHLGEFKISNSYSSGDISVLNDATDTRLVAGGFIGSELDLSFITQLAEILVEKSNTVTTGDEGIDPYIQMVSLYGSNGLIALQQLGIPFKSGFSISNSFTTSQVPQSTPFNKDTLLQEIGSGMPEQGITSGALFGFALSIDSQEMRDLIDNALSTILNSQPSDLEGGSLLDSDLFDNAMNALNEFSWKDSAALAPNSYYDGSKVDTDRCANSLPTTSELVTFLIPKIASAMSGESGQVDYFSFIPPIKTLGGVQCVSVNATGSNPNYFKNNTTVAPLTAWDFNSTWKVQHDDFPTFVNDPAYVPNNGDDSAIPPGVDTPNPTTGGPGSFIPKKITKDNLNKTFARVKALIKDKPVTRVLPKVLKDVNNKLDAEAASLKKDKSSEDNGLLASVLGIMSKTGVFLLRNIVTVLMLLVIGSMLTIYGHKRKELDSMFRLKK